MHSRLKRLALSVFLLCAIFGSFRAQNKPIKVADIEGIFMVLEYQMGVGGGFYPTYEPYVAFKDGRLLTDASLFPLLESGDAKAASKAANAWGTWKINGGALTLQKPNGKTEIIDGKKEKWYRGRPGGPQQKLTGRYRSVGGGGNTALGGTDMIFTSSAIEFMPDGSFTQGNVTGGSGEHAGVRTTTRSQQSARGTYKIDGYILELRFEDGHVQRSLFYIYPDSDNAIGIGSRQFSRPKK